jgi:putative tricarboxylic transport membrane protein
MIGLFAIPEVLASIGRKDEITNKKNQIMSLSIKSNLLHFIKVLKKIPKILPTILKSSLVGTGIGSIPGTGSAIAAVIGYELAKKSSKKPEEFGKGSIEGISAPEAANTSMCGGALIPMLTLGIPGDPVTAVMLGALMIQGLNPGPLLFTENIDLVYTFFGSYFVAIPLTLLFTVLAIPIFIRVIRIPSKILMPIILLLSIVGAFALQRNIVDIWIMFVFGCLAFIMNKYKFPTLPLLLGIILGGPLERNFRMSLLLSEGSFLTFIQRPISLILILLTVGYLILQYKGIKRTAK